MSVLKANLRSSGPRLGAAGAAVAVAVAFIITGMLLLDALNRTVTAEAEAEATGADVVITSEALMMWEDNDDGDASSQVHYGDRQLAEEIMDLDQVQSAYAVRSTWLNLSETGGVEGGVLRVQNVGPTHQLEILEGRLPESKDEILLTDTTAEGENLQVGDTVTAYSVSPDAQTGQGRVQTSFTVVGTTDTGGSEGGYLTEAAMGALADDPLPETLRVALDDAVVGDPAAQQDVQQQIADVLQQMLQQDEIVINVPSAEGEAAAQEVGEFGEITVAGVQIATQEQIVDAWVGQRTGDTEVLRYMALGFGAIALFVAGMVIANTFQVIVASRQRTMALIRAVGGSAAQLRRATLLEGAVLGLLGGAAGVLLGWGLAQVLVVTGNLLTDALQLHTVLPTPTAVTAGLSLGIAVTMLSAVYPAVRASRVSPIAALRPADVQAPRNRLSGPRLVIGAVMALCGLAATLYAALASAVPDQLGNQDPVLGLPLPLLGAAGALVGFLGLMLLARRFVPPVIALMGKGLSRVGAAPVPSRLAGQNARQVPGRTTATASALLVGVTLVVSMTVGAATAQKLLFSELAESQPVDAALPVASEEVDELLEQSPDARSSLGLPVVSAELAGAQEVEVAVVPAEGLDAVTHAPDMTPEPGEVLAARSLAHEPDSAVEDDAAQLRLAPQGSESAEIEADVTWVDWLPHGMVMISAETVPSQDQAWTADSDLGLTMVRLSESAAEPEIRALADELEREASVEDAFGSFSGGLIRASHQQVIDVVLAVVLALLGASVVIAVIGVSNTLSLSVSERQREAALLRALGMGRRGVGLMISIEAVLLAVAALLIGTALGVFFGWAGVSSLIAREDWTVVLDVPWGRLAVIWLVTLVAALLAAWLPARRMRRTLPAEGLSHAA